MKVRRFAVVGDPVAHSKSPAMHAAAYRALGLPHVYEAIHATAAELPRVVASLREGLYDGLNVTVPHKERVLSLVDAVDAGARVAGAANTLVRSDDGRITAHNTDAPALAAELRRLAPDHRWTEASRALVLGSGGAARAAIAAFAELGVSEIVVRARGFDDPARRDRFLASAPAPVTLERWAPSDEGRTVAVVQATSAGMKGASPGDEVAGAVGWASLPDHAVALDVVYSPRDTPWLRAARARGLRADDGLGMLARQGALAMELWLGGLVRMTEAGELAPLDAMRRAIE
jgi:shikimate dehydrogenase